MTLNGNYTLWFKIHAFLDPTTKISMKTDPLYQQRRCSILIIKLNSLDIYNLSVNFVSGLPCTLKPKNRKTFSKNLGFSSPVSYVRDAAVCSNSGITAAVQRELK